MGTAHQGGHVYDAIVVGSGMGGAVVARELAAAGRDVLVLEHGEPQAHVGAFADVLRMYDGNALTRVPKKSKEGVFIYRALAAGGSTLVSCGNAVRCLEGEIGERGIELGDDMAAMEAEMGMCSLAEERLSEMGTRIRNAGHEVGCTFELMPKMVDCTICHSCGCCAMGCARDAKWTALRPLSEAVSHGAEVLYGVTVDRAIHDGGHVLGVSGHAQREPFEARSRTVVLAAGGLGTPVILNESGISSAGGNLFIDTFVNVYGMLDEDLNNVEPQMSLVDTEFHDDRGFLMAPFINYPRGIRLIELGPVAAARPVRKTIGMMVKTADDPSGTVHPDGSVSKDVTAADRKRIDDGAAMAADVLVAAGARPDSIVVSKPQGAHPGGTAAIGHVVGTDLQTELDGLFVADASVLPETPGMPPMVTIGALARRLGRSLATA